MQMRIWKNDRRPALWPHRVPPAYLLLMFCCILLAAGFALNAIFASAPVEIDAAAHGPASGGEQPAWGTEGAVTMYGGAYTAVISNLRFEPAGAASPHRELVADLLYSNLSPFVVHIERNSRIQAHVFAGDGSPLGTFAADSQDLGPGGAVQVPMSLGTDYGVARHAGEEVSVLFTDAGGNLAGRMTAPLDK